MEIKDMVIIADLELIPTVVIAFATVVTTWLVKRQCRIAEKQIHNDLFKLRYKFYVETLEFIKSFEPPFVKTAQKIKSLKQKNETVKEVLYTRLLRQIDYFLNNKSQIHHSAESLVKKSIIIFKAKCLFGLELANFLEDYLSEANLSKQIKNYYQQKSNELGCSNIGVPTLENVMLMEFGEEYKKQLDIHLENKINKEMFAEKLIDEIFSIKYWTPDQEFNAKFEKYLQLK